MREDNKWDEKKKGKKKKYLVCGVCYSKLLHSPTWAQGGGVSATCGTVVQLLRFYVCLQGNIIHGFFNAVYCCGRCAY